MKSVEEYRTLIEATAADLAAAQAAADAADVALRAAKVANGSIRGEYEDAVRWRMGTPEERRQAVQLYEMGAHRWKSRNAEERRLELAHGVSVMVPEMVAGTMREIAYMTRVALLLRVYERRGPEWCSEPMVDAAGGDR